MLSWTDILLNLCICLPVSYLGSYGIYMFFKQARSKKQISALVPKWILTSWILLTIGYRFPYIMAPDGRDDVLYVGAPLIAFSFWCFLPLGFVKGAKIANGKFRGYIFIISAAMAICVIDLGLQWIVPMFRFCRNYNIERYLACASFAILILCQLAFMARNDGQFFPKDPK